MKKKAYYLAPDCDYLFTIGSEVKCSSPETVDTEDVEYENWVI